MKKERSSWRDVAEMMDGDRQIVLGKHITYWFRRTPRRALNYMSYYKFAAKMIGNNKLVLDIGCSEGLGTWLIANECGFARGVDFDEDAIVIANHNWQDKNIEFICCDFLGDIKSANNWDAAVSFDVIEHFQPQNAHRFLGRIAECVAHNGIVIIGTPSLQGQQYASEVTRAGHVNLYDAPRLKKEMLEHFHHVFIFSANDEVVHTGFSPMAHYLIAVACRKKIID